MNYKILNSHLSESEIKYYEDINPGWTVKTTNCLLVTFEDGTSTTYITNQELLEEYIRFKGALIELGKVGNAFTAELSNNELAFKENGQKIAYISNNSLVITNAEVRNKLSLGNETRGWFDFIPRSNGNLSIKWRGPAL